MWEVLAVSTNTNTNLVEFQNTGIRLETVMGKFVRDIYKHARVFDTRKLISAEVPRQFTTGNNCKHNISFQR